MSNHAPGAPCRQRFELRDVQIVGGGDALQSVVANVVIGGERIGDVEREVAAPALVGEPLQVVVVADEVAVGLARQHLLENPFLARLEDARRGDPEGLRRERERVQSPSRERSSRKRCDGVAVALSGPRTPQ